MRRKALPGAGLLVVVALLSVGNAGAASAAGGGQAGPADEAAERALADRFAPVVALVHQDVECGPGEPYQPSDVDLVLGDQSVALRGPWTGDEVVKAGPTAEDLERGPVRLPPGLPGNPLEAGCDYEKWVRATAPAHRPRRTPTWRPRSAGTTGSPCSTGSSTRSTTTPTSTRATGR